jgi:hypothetical protein
MLALRQAASEYCAFSVLFDVYTHTNAHARTHATPLLHHSGCESGFWGQYCSACPICGPHGHCDGSGTSGGTGTCICDAGWEGNACNKASQPTPTPSPRVSPGKDAQVRQARRSVTAPPVSCPTWVCMPHGTMPACTTLSLPAALALL